MRFLLVLLLLQLFMTHPVIGEIIEPGDISTYQMEFYNASNVLGSNLLIAFEDGIDINGQEIQINYFENDDLYFSFIRSVNSEKLEHSISFSSDMLGATIDIEFNPLSDDILLPELGQRITLPSEIPNNITIIDLLPNIYVPALTTTETDNSISNNLVWFILLIVVILVAYWYLRNSKERSINLKYWKQEIRNRWDIFLERLRLIYISIIGQKINIDETSDTGLETAEYVTKRRCCKLHGRLGDTYCDVCGRVIPEEWIVEK